MLRREQMGAVLQRLFRVVEHCGTRYLGAKKGQPLQTRTKYDRVSWLPSFRFHQHSSTLEHHSHGKSIVGSARTRKCAVQMRIDEYRGGFAAFRTVRYTDNDVRKVDVGFIKSLVHHVKPEKCAVESTERYEWIPFRLTYDFRSLAASKPRTRASDSCPCSQPPRTIV